MIKLDPIHWLGFKSFAAAELATGGPDPQVRLTATALRNIPGYEAATFRACVFVAAYTCGAAAALWNLSSSTVFNDATEKWLLVNAEGLPLRRERRAVMGPKNGPHPRKFLERLRSCSTWAKRWSGQLLSLNYEEAWSAADELRFFGRYAKMKVLETLNLRGLLGEEQIDIRARDAKFPRRTLGLIFPDHATVLTELGNSRLSLQCATELSAEIMSESELEMTWFQLETLLCNYRQALDGKYPGRSHDRELGHFLRAERHWGQEYLLSRFPFYELRAKLFPDECLGELGGWTGARKELEIPWLSSMR